MTARISETSLFAGGSDRPAQPALARFVHQRFEAQVRRGPDRIAVICRDRSLTYGELNARANHLARQLRELGVTADVRVAICVERSPELMIGLLAILKAGGAFVPIDPAYPPERLAFILSDADPAAVLTHGAARRALDDLGADGASLPILDLDAETPDGSDADLLPGDVGLTADSLAYVIYTSGSTGQPKGVMVEHRGVTNLYDWYAQAYIDDLQRVLIVSSHAFDLTLKNLFTPLLCGGAVVMPPSGLLAGGPLVDAIARYDVTLVNCAPSQIYDAVAERAQPPACLRRVILGGEQIRPDRLRAWSHASALSFVNSYGPTEITDVAVDGPLRFETLGAIAPIGQPIANTKIYVVDERLEPVPVGVAGELLIGGAGVARGYLNRPELTAERFIPSPFVEGERLYRTGDLARYLPDGDLEFLGRNDFQVKIRGFRIEPGEIEARLTEHPDVRDAVVVAREDDHGDKRLVAYWTAARLDIDLPTAELRRHLAATLPDYMVPPLFVRLDALPLTPNGKLDRKALPAPDVLELTATAYEAPSGPIETQLAQIWAEILGVQRIGRHDDFFDLGGHSLLAVRLAARAAERFGVEVAVSTLMPSITLADLSAEISRLQAS